MRNKENALVAEANLAECHTLEKALRDSGYQVTVAENPDTLISLAQRLLPSVILLSADFGGAGGGITLGRHLKADPITRFCALILLCGREHELPDCGRAEQPDEILVHPIHPPEVLVRLRSVKRLQRFAHEASQGSKLDSLTGTFNNAYMLDRLHHEVLRASRYGRSLALVMVDLDGFTDLNQRQGTTFGDLVLREAARALTSHLRGVDLVARSGDDDFTIILPETSLLVARPIGERLRLAMHVIGQHAVADKEQQEGDVQITASLGVAGMPHPEARDVQDLLRCARKAQQRARRAGGDLTVVY